MKKYLAISLLAVALLLIALRLLPSREKTPKSATLAPTQGTGASATENVGQPRVDTLHTAPYSNKSAGKATQIVSSATSEERMRAVIEAKNVPIEFWGRVVDQSNAPLSGVKIESRIRHWDLGSGFGSPGRIIKDGMTTGGNGDFHVGGSTGDDLTIQTMAKDGYELEPNARLGFGYNNADQFTSHPETPVVFKMWQKDIHEQLIAGQKSFHIVPDGSPLIIDLSKGMIAESGKGEIKVWVKRPEQVTLGQRYDWSCEMDVVNGGLLQETNANSSMYSAPADGYTPSFHFEQKVGSGWGDSTGPIRFYIMLNNGQEYGRITIELFAYYNDRVPGLVRVEYAINPSGSHVLR
jgi:hypothetical protein